MKWFRFHTEALNDPKVQRLPAQLFRQWVNLLCVAAEREGDDWGTLPSVPALAYQLRKSETSTTVLLASLIAAGLIDDDGETYRIHNWDKRQYKSDDVTARVKRHRKQDGNVSRNGTETPPETDTEQTQTTDGRRIDPILPLEGDQIRTREAKR